MSNDDPAPPASNEETNRDKVLCGEPVPVTDSRLAEMQGQAIAAEGIGLMGPLHWHWASAINELIAARAELERLTREQDDAELRFQNEVALTERLIREIDWSRKKIEELDRFNTGLATESERRRAALESAYSIWSHWQEEHTPCADRMADIINNALSGEPARIACPAEQSQFETCDGPWQSIETAPKDGRTLLLGYYNSAGKWRTMRGQWFTEGSMDEWDGDEPDNNPAGWYETCVENDDPPNCWATEPTHWQPTPRPPEKASGEPG